jgi:hypothetical protein
MARMIGAGILRTKSEKLSPKSTNTGVSELQNLLYFYYF